jgi:hypothetical protein
MDELESPIDESEGNENEVDVEGLRAMVLDVSAQMSDPVTRLNLRAKMRRAFRSENGVEAEIPLFLQTHRHAAHGMLRLIGGVLEENFTQADALKILQITQKLLNQRLRAVVVESDE